jgi:hypothetical protein
MAVVGEVTSDIVFYVLKVTVLKRGEVARRRMLANPRDVIPTSNAGGNAMKRLDNDQNKKHTWLNGKAFDCN